MITTAEGRTAIFTTSIPSETGVKRDRVKQALAEAGIGSMIYYPVPLHQLPVYKDRAPSLPIAERLVGEVLSLPVWPGLPEEAPERVAQVIKKALNS